MKVPIQDFVEGFEFTYDGHRVRFSHWSKDMRGVYVHYIDQRGEVIYQEPLLVGAFKNDKTISLALACEL